MTKIAKDTLGYLGVDYQYRLINAFVSDPNYFRDNFSIIDPNKFTDHYLKSIVGVMKDYYNKMEIVPSYNLILIELRSRVINTEEDEQYFNEVIDKIKKVGSEGYEAVEAIGERFFKQQEMLGLANGLRQAASEGDVEKIDEYYSKMEKLATMGRRGNEISTPMENVEQDLSAENIVAIPTGIDRLDEVLGGGLEKGKLGIIIGSAGFGKTSMTTCFAANAATTKCENNDFEGYKVLQIVFEDTHRDIHRKYFSKISQIETGRINESEETTNLVREILKNSEDSETINNNVRIVKFPSGEKSASDIKAFIKQKINEGFNPDLVIVDYFGCVAPEPGTSKEDITARESKTMRKFETMASELNIAMWIPVQSNREGGAKNTKNGDSNELVTNDKIGGSISKYQIAHVVLTITRSVNDQQNNRATLCLTKNRSGLGTLTLEGIIFNNGTCTIKCDDIVEFDTPDDYTEYAKETEQKKENESRTYLLKMREEAKNSLRKKTV